MVVASAVLHAQAPPNIAELEAKVTAASEAEKSAALRNLSVALQSVDTAKALEAARRARTAAFVPHDELLADARIATLQRLLGNYVEAMTTASAALDHAIEVGDESARAELLLAYARCNWSLGDYPAAMAAHQDLISLAEKIGNRVLVARGHLGLSVVYGELKDRAKARAEEETALKIAREVGDRETEADALNNLGNNFRYSGDLDSARHSHEQSLAIRAALGARRGVGDSHINLSDVARDAKDHRLALDHAGQALAIYQQLGLPRYIANAHLQIATILREDGRLDDALARLRIGLAIAEPLGSQSQLVSYYQESSTLFAARGEWQAAYEAERKRATAADAVLGDKSRQQLTALSTRMELERHRQEIALLRGEQARKEATFRAKDANLRAKEADLVASSSELEAANAMQFSLGVSLLAIAVTFGAIIVVQRVRLRAEQRVLAETRAAKESAEEADRLKTRFLGIASHDIRAPLGNIVNVSELLRASATTDGTERRERLDTIATEAQRVLVLVEDLITTAALETGKLELRVAPFDLAEVAIAAAGSLRWQANAKRQQIVLPSLPADSVVIDGDAARIHQVASNLVANAIKFGPPESTITVAVAHTDKVVTLSVRDEGPGVSEADVERMFAPFQRLAGHSTSTTTSHGLGLSIAQEIVRLHGGAIRVDSRPGEGATFRVELPVQRAG